MNILRGQNKEQGTSLVDVLMAVAIIAIMCTGLVGSLTYGFFVMGNARENQRATQVMLETLESVRLYNWDQVHSNGFIPTTFTNVYDPQAPAGQQGIIYYGTLATNSVNLGKYDQFQYDLNDGWASLDQPQHPPRSQRGDLYRQGRHSELCLLSLWPDESPPGP